MRLMRRSKWKRNYCLSDPSPGSGASFSLRLVLVNIFLVFTWRHRCHVGALNKRETIIMQIMSHNLLLFCAFLSRNGKPSIFNGPLGSYTDFTSTELQRRCHSEQDIFLSSVRYDEVFNSHAIIWNIGYESMAFNFIFSIPDEFVNNRIFLFNWFFGKRYNRCSIHNFKNCISLHDLDLPL